MGEISEESIHIINTLVTDTITAQSKKTTHARIHTGGPQHSTHVSSYPMASSRARFTICLASATKPVTATPWPSSTLWILRLLVGRSILFRTGFSTARTTPSRHLRPRAVPPFSTALEAYSTWKMRPSGEKVEEERSYPLPADMVALLVVWWWLVLDRRDTRYKQKRNALEGAGASGERSLSGGAEDLGSGPDRCSPCCRSSHREEM